MATRGTKGTNVTGISPAPEGGLVDAQELTGLTQGDPTGREGFGCVTKATNHRHEPH
jgi:hypothetical protein